MDIWKSVPLPWNSQTIIANFTEEVRIIAVLVKKNNLRTVHMTFSEAINFKHTQNTIFTLLFCPQFFSDVPQLWAWTWADCSSSGAQLAHCSCAVYAWYHSDVFWNFHHHRQTHCTHGNTSYCPCPYPPGYNRFSMVRQWKDINQITGLVGSEIKRKSTKKK